MFKMLIIFAYLTHNLLAGETEQSVDYTWYAE